MWVVGLGAPSVSRLPLNAPRLVTSHRASVLRRTPFTPTPARQVVGKMLVGAEEAEAKLEMLLSRKRELLGEV